MIHAEVSIYPIGTGATSISFYIAKSIQAIRDIPNLRHVITPMGTVLEAETIEAVNDAVRQMSEAVHSLGVDRLEIITKIDSRRDRNTGLDEKIDSVKSHMK